MEPRRKLMRDRSHGHTLPCKPRCVGCKKCCVPSRRDSCQPPQKLCCNYGNRKRNVRNKRPVGPRISATTKSRMCKCLCVYLTNAMCRCGCCARGLPCLLELKLHRAVIANEARARKFRITWKYTFSKHIYMFHDTMAALPPAKYKLESNHAPRTNQPIAGASASAQELMSNSAKYSVEKTPTIWPLRQEYPQSPQLRPQHRPVPLGLENHQTTIEIDIF